MIDLSLLFDYDLWATRRWLVVLPALKNLGRAHEILEHMIRAQTVWLDRIGVESKKPEGNIPMDAVFEHLSSAWKFAVEHGPLDSTVGYSTANGDPYSNTLREIAQHVINHGTYHRGQLRGLAESEGFEGFPDTDLIIYLRDS